MAKPSIKRIKIQATTEGVKETYQELDKVNQALSGINENVTSFNRRTKNMGATFTTLNKRAGSLSKSISNAAKEFNRFNRSMGDTKAREKAISGYLDNIELVTLQMKELQSVAADTANSMSKLGSHGIQSMVSDEVIGYLDMLTEQLEHIAVYTRQAAINTATFDERLEDLGDTSDSTARNTRKATGALEDFNKEMREASKRSKAQQDYMNKNANNLRQGGRTGAKAFSRLAFQSNALVLAYASIAANVYAASEAFRVLSEAANFDRLIDQTATFSAAVSGINVKGLARDIQEASGNALSLKEALNFATRGTAFNFTTEQMEKLTIGARKASIALGIEFNNAMDRVTRGISKQEIELFDELGIVTRLTPAFEKYGGAIGKAVDELSDYERQTALYLEVQRQLDQKFSGIDIASTAYEKLGAVTKTLTDNFLIWVAKGLEPAAEAVAEIGDTAIVLDRLAKLAGKENPTTFTDTLSEINAFMLGDLRRDKPIIGSQELKDIKNLASAYEDVNEQVKVAYGAIDSLLNSGLRSGGPAVIAIEQLTSELGKMNSAIAPAKALIKAYTKELEESISLNGDLRNVPSMSGPRADIRASVISTQQQQLAETIEILTNAIKKQSLETLSAEQALKNYSAALATSLGITSGEAASMDQILSNSIGAWLKGLPTVTAELSALATEIRKPKTAFTELRASIASVNNVGDKMKEMPGIVKVIAEEFETFAKKMSIDTNVISDWDEYLQRLNDIDSNASRASIALDKLKASRTKIRDVSGSSLTTDMRGYSESLKTALMVSEEELKYAEELYKNNFDSKQLTDQELEVERARLDLLGVELELQKALYHMTLKKIRAEDKISTVERSNKFSLDRNAVLGNRVTDEERNTSELDLMGLRIDAAEIDLAAAKLTGKEEAIAAAQKELDDLNALKLSIELNLPIDSVNDFKNAISSLSSAISGLSGLTELQQQFMGVYEQIAGSTSALKALGNGNVFEGAKQGFADLFTAMSGDGIEALKGDTEARAKATLDAVSAMAQGAMAIFDEVSRGRIASIDAEIAAEKARDGKSAESLAKIKKLEAKKIKEEAKAKKASVAMSTAVAIMQAFAQLGVWGAIPAAGFAILGALQMSNIDKAASGQINALNAGDASMKITGGTRDNSIDVSKGASAGEYGFLTGASGQGSAGNFKLGGRAGFGSVSAGTPIEVGERGSEVIVPKVPIEVRDKSSAGAGIQVTVPLSFQALDGKDIESKIPSIARAIREAVESELQAEGRSLSNL